LVGVPLPIIYAALVAIAIWYVLDFRPVGRHLYAIGANEEAARLVGIKVKRLVLGAFVTSAALSSLGGVLVAVQVGSAAPNTLDYLLLPAFTAVFLGATSIRPGHYNVWGTVIAVYLLGSVTTGMFMLGAPAFWAPIINGIILLLAIGLAKFSSRRFDVADELQGNRRTASFAAQVVRAVKLPGSKKGP
jgi:ribose transport system permease protein